MTHTIKIKKVQGKAYVGCSCGVIYAPYKINKKNKDLFDKKIMATHIAHKFS